MERAASTLALGRLIRRDAEGLERQMHRTLLTALLDHSRPVDEIALRARALGVMLDRRHLVGVMVRHRRDTRRLRDAGDGRLDPAPGRHRDLAGPEAGQARLRDLAEAVGQALRETKLSALTSAGRRPGGGRRCWPCRTPAAEDRAPSPRFAAALRRRPSGHAPTAGTVASCAVAAMRTAVLIRVP